MAGTGIGERKTSTDILAMATRSGFESEELFDGSDSFSSDESEFEEPPAPRETLSKTLPIATKVRPRLFSSEQRHDQAKRRRLYESLQREETPQSTTTACTPTGRPRASSAKNQEPKTEPTCARSDDHSSSTLATALGELTNTLNQVVKRLEKTETRIRSMEEKIDSHSTSLSSSSNDSRKKSRTIPVIVRVSWILLSVLCTFFCFV